MRYHFGLGVGHVYARHSSSGRSDDSPTSSTGRLEEHNNEEPAEEAMCDEGPSSFHGDISQLDSDSSSSTDGRDSDDSVESREDPTDDEEFYAMEEMYGSTDF